MTTANEPQEITATKAEGALLSWISDIERRLDAITTGAAASATTLEAKTVAALRHAGSPVEKFFPQGKPANVKAKS
jgi:hypothetical protein